MPKRLRGQLSLAIAVPLLLAVALMSLLTNLFSSHAFDDYVQQQELSRSQTIADDLASQFDSLKGGWDDGFLHTIGMYSLYSGYLIKVYNNAGDLVWDAENHDMTLCWQIMDEISARMEQARRVGAFATRTYDLKKGDGIVGKVAVRYYAPFFYSEADHRFVGALDTAFLVIALACGAAALLLGRLLARRIARPVAEAAAGARRIAGGDYGVQLREKADSEELRGLICAINHLSAALDTQEKLRKRLTTDIAHELRTPIAAVTLYLEAMRDGLWEVTPERLAQCHSEMARLGALVGELQQLANVESESPRLVLVPVDLRAVADAVAESLAAEAAAKRQSVEVEGAAEPVPADDARMRQVLLNLASNAVKYTPEGGHIRLAVTDSPEAAAVRVIDDGVGVTAAELPLIFERFYRVDGSRNRRTGGAGIGLTIAWGIVEAHGGTLTAESEPGKGSCFTMRIPRQQGRATATAEATESLP